MSLRHAARGRGAWKTLALVVAAAALIAGGVLFLLTRPPQVKFISREGLQGGAPPCSIAGARAAKEAGYDSIRVSLRRTADGVWVLCHDETVNEQARLPDGSELPAGMAVEKHTYDELAGYDYGIKYGVEYAGLSLTRAEDFLAVAGELELEVLLEVKTDLDDALADDLCGMVVRAGYGESIWFSAFSMEPLLMLQARLPKANLAFIDHFSQEALDRILQGGICSPAHRTRLDCFRRDSFDVDLIREYYRQGVDIKVGSAYTEEEIVGFLKLGINTIEVGGVDHPQRLLSQR